MIPLTRTCLVILFATLPDPAALAQEPARAANPDPRPAQPVRPAPRAVRRNALRFQVVIRGDEQGITYEVAEPPVPAPKGDLDEEEEKASPMPPANRRVVAVVVGRDNFDRVLYESENLLFKPDVLAVEARERLERMLERRVDEAVRGHRLTDAERAKLRLAGQGDIKRFFDRVEERRADFEAARNDHDRAVSQLRQVRPLAAEYQHGPFGVDSLFAKTLWTMVNRPEPAR